MICKLIICRAISEWHTYWKKAPQNIIKKDSWYYTYWIWAEVVYTFYLTCNI